MDEIAKVEYRLPAVPFEEMSEAQKFEATRLAALKDCYEAYNLTIEEMAAKGEDWLKAWRARKEHSRHLMSMAIKVDDQALRHQEHDNAMQLLREKMERARAKLPPVIDATIDPEKK